MSRETLLHNQIFQIINAEFTQECLSHWLIVILNIVLFSWADVEKVLYSQTFGGLVFAFFGGTPHIVLLTTAPLALYTKSKYSTPHRITSIAKT